MKMEEKLIAAVMTFPELYNRSMKEYKDPSRRTAAWRSAALQVGITEEDARKKWRNLRDKYRKERMAEKERRSKSSVEPKRTWRFMPMLQFLEPYFEGRHDTGSETDSFSASEASPHAAEAPSCSTGSRLAMPEENFGQLTSGPVIPFECPRTPARGPSRPLRGRSRPSPPKREHTELSAFEAQVMNTLSNRQDEDDYFGCSVAATLKRLSPKKKRLLRCRIEQLVYDVEFGDDQ